MDKYKSIDDISDEEAENVFDNDIIQAEINNIKKEKNNFEQYLEAEKEKISKTIKINYKDKIFTNKTIKKPFFMRLKESFNKNINKLHYILNK